jgi:protease I
MTNRLQGKRIAFLTANEGVEQVELTEPRRAVREAGAEAELLAPEAGEVQAFNHLKPVAVICHGPWTLIDAGVAEGRTLTSWSIRASSQAANQTTSKRSTQRSSRSSPRACTRPASESGLSGVASK